MRRDVVEEKLLVQGSMHGSVKPLFGVAVNTSNTSSNRFQILSRLL